MNRNLSPSLFSRVPFLQELYSQIIYLSSTNFMKTILRLKSLLFIFIGIGLNFSSLAQIYQYTDNSSGTPFAVNSNATGGSLTRGSGLAASATCNASTEGFGASSFVTTTAATIGTADGTGDYVSFTITPKAGYRLNITGFTANLRAISGGPTAVRYAYNDGAGSLVQNGVSLTPGTSVSCANAGSVENWASFSPLVTTQTVTFKIFGFNGSGGDLHLKTITVAGTVECNPAIAASIAPTSPSICVGNAVTLTGSVTGSIPSLTHAWSILSGGSFGTLSSPTTNATNLITGTGAGTVNTEYTASYGSSPSCSVSATKAVIVNPLPALTPNLNPQVCLGTATTNMSYSGVSGTPNVYSLNFDAAAEAKGFVDVLNQTFSFGSSGNIAITVPTVSPITAGTYNATLVVENTLTGCESIVYNIIVTVNALPTVSITGSTTVCVGATTPLTGNSSPAAVTSSWATSAPAVATVSSVGVVSGVAVGNSDITFTSTDGNGCTKTSSPFNVVVNPLPTGTLTFTETSGVSNDGTVCSGDAVNFTATAGFANYNFKVDGVSAQNGASNTYMGTFAVNGTVTVEITSANTCMNTLTGIPITVGTCGVHNITTNKYFVTIQAGVNAASTVNGNTLEVASGTYNEQVLVNKELIIKGVGLTKPIVNFTGTATGKLTLFDISKPNVTIENLVLSVDLSKIGGGIVASDATLDTLTVKNNDFNPYRSSASNATAFGLRNAISINYGAYRVSGNNPTGLLIQGNTVSYNLGADLTAGTSDDAGFRAGVSSDVGVGTFTGNTFQSVSQDLELRFSNPGNLVVTNNNINGGGVEISEHNTASGTVTVSGNTFNGAFGNTYTNILRLKNNQVQKPTTVSGNTFTNTVWAASLENYRDVTFNNNTFTPLSGSTTYQHITVNTKLFSSGSATNIQTAIDGTFTNNTFNGSGATGGKAFAFYNQDSDNAAFGTFTVGTSGNENNFNTGIQNFIFFDGSTGNSVAPITPMAPWAQNLDASFNKFDVSGSLKLPSAMTFAERTSLENALTHKPDNAALGLISYFNPVHNLTQNTYFATIQPAITAAVASDVIELSEFTYSEAITIDKSLTIQGLDSALVILDGASVGAANGITINTGIQNVTIKNLKIKNFTGSGNIGSAIFGAGATNNLMIDAVVLDNNQGRGGVYLSGNGGISNVTIKNSISKNHAVAGSRGIVIWDGFKQNITITGNKVYGNNCCGIELQDGSASGVTVTGNMVLSNVDNGIGLIGLTGPGANIVSGNIVTNNGRFGMEIKNPNGNGLSSGGGSVVIDGNTVSRTIPIVDARDIAGIAVFRRGVTALNIDVPQGAVVKNNTVSGYTQPSTSDGFGIVVEGINHTVSTNTVSGNDVGIQRQAGHLPYPGDGDQTNVSDTYFGRGNSPVSCGITLTGNTLSTNGVDTRDVGNSDGTGVVTNTNTNEIFCTIQAAVAATNTVNGNTLEASSGTYNEQVLVNKELIIKGVGLTKPVLNFTGTPTGKLTLFDVSKPNVTIENFTLSVDVTKLGSAVLGSDATLSALTVKDNSINPYRSGAGTVSFGLRNAISINYGAYRVGGNNPVGLLIQGNTISYNNGVDAIAGTADDAGFRAGVSSDVGVGTFTTNTIQSISQDFELRFSNPGNLVVTNNNINGGGLEISEHNTASGAVTVSGNTFNGTAGNTYTNILRLKNNQVQKPTTVSGNTFTNTVWAASLENYRDVTFNNNTFTPLSGSTTYQHITVNTKLFSSGSATNVQTAIDGTFTNNTFNGSGATGGKAFAFYNQDSDNAAFGTFTVGTSGNENNFNTGIQNFIFFDGSTGSSPGPTPATPMAPWAQNLDATYNKFDVSGSLKLPSAMTFAERTSLENALTHKPDNAALGLISYFNPVHNLTQNTYFSTIQPSIAAAVANDVIELSEWTFAEGITIDKPLTIQGVDSSSVILDGATIADANGITLANGIQNIIIKNLKIKNFKGTGSIGSGIFGIQNNNLMIDAVVLDNNQGRGGVYLSGGSNIQNVTIKNSISKNNIVPGSRGIVIWDGFKENITITGNKVYGNNCCGIELQDGSASGVTVTGNMVVSNFDNGIGLIGLTGPGANIVSGNIVTNNGRFGMEIKNPNGNGLSSGAGSVVIDGNTVSRTIPIVDARDIAGIAVFRRGVTSLNIDVPQGVVVKNNTVSGYVQPSTSDGFGIVVEGINHSVATNTVSGNDVGIQRQAGHLPYPADGDQTNLSDTYFGRGNSPVSCGITLTGNTLSTNTINTRDVGNSDGTGVVTNTNTNKLFCTIQSAINDVATVNGNVITATAGTYAENITVSKSLDIRGPNYGISPVDGSTRVPEAIVVPAVKAIDSGEIFHVATSNVKIDGFIINGDNPALTSGFTSTNGADIDAAEGITVYEDNINNLIVTNNILRNLSYFGVTLYGGSSPVPTSGHIITDNKFQNFGTYDVASNINLWGGGVLLYNNQYAEVSNNLMTNVRSGIQTGNFYQANPGTIASQIINDNTIQARRVGVFHNLHYASASPFTFTNNRITGLANANETGVRGILLGSLSVNSTLNNNNIDLSGITANSTGIEVWNVKNTTPASIIGGTLSNINTGIFVNNYDGYNSNATDGGHATISGVTINPNSSGTGIRLFDNPLSTHVGVEATIGSGVTINISTNGIVVENTSAKILSPLGNVAFVGQTGDYIKLINNANDIDGGLPTFGGILASAMTQPQRVTLEGKLTHKFDNSALGRICLPTSGVLSSSLTAVCAGGSANLSVVIVSATGPFTLIYTDGTTPVTITGYVSGTNIPITPSATKTYSIVSITDAIGCISTTGFTGTPTVTVNQLTGATTFTAGATTVCQDAADETYTATAANSTSIVYSVLPVIAGVINASTGVMNWDVAFSGTATITATATGLCGTTTADRIVTVNPKTGATTFTAGATTVCQDAPDGTYTATAANSTSIVYSVLPVTAGVINASTGVMNWDAAFSGTATITATSTGLCGTTTANRVVIVRPLPTVYNVSGTGSICSGVASPILLSGSNTGINYKLKTNTFGYLGSVLAGTGSGLSFTPPSTPTGTYFIEATNATTGCISQMNGTVATIIATMPTISVTSQTNVSCKDGSDASVTVLASAGTGSYNYSFNGGTTQASGTFSGKTAGTYPIVANDITSGCSASINVTFTQPATLPSVTVAVSGTACTGNTVTLTATATGGTPLYIYSWNSAGGTTSSTFSVTSTSTTTLLVADSKGCVVPTVSTTVTFNTPTPPTITGATTVCSGSTISLATTGGGTYAWSGPNSFTSTSAAISITNATVSNSGTYIITVTDANSCMASSSVSVTVNPIPATPTPQANANIPIGGSITLTATGCSGTLKWYKSADNSPVTMPVSPTVATNYYAKCEQTTNSVTCESAKSADVTVTIGDIVISIITGGAWNDPATWDVARVPLATDKVIIDTNHTVIVTDMNAIAKSLEYRTNAKVTFGNPATKLIIQGL
jgi:uncharacterized Zn ribbon protein